MSATSPSNFSTDTNQTIHKKVAVAPQRQNNPYQICFRNIYEEQPGEGMGTPWLRLWKNG